MNRSALKEKEGREDDAEDEVEVDFEHKLEAIVLLRALCFSFFACKRVLNFGNNCGSITIYLSNFLQHLPKETHIAGWLIGHLHLQHCLSVRHHPNMCTHTKKKMSTCLKVASALGAYRLEDLATADVNHHHVHLPVADA